MELLETALEYHNRGYFVFAIGGRKDDPNGKKPSTRVGSWRDRIATEKDIGYWFSDPLVTGMGLRLDNLVAIDIDTYNGQEVGKLCDGASAVISGRGVTSLWKLPKGVTLKTNDKLTNCEVKTGGGAYIVMPPSMHIIKGSPYEWRVGEGPWDASELPPPLIRILRQDRGGPAASRHTQLMQRAVSLRQSGANEAEILAGLEEYNAGLEKPKDDDPKELPEIARWAFSKVANVKVTALTLREEFVNMYKGQLLYVVDVGRECWRAWNGHYWEEYGKGLFKSLVLQAVDHVRELARTKMYKPFWANSLAQWAPGEPALHTKEEIFDNQLDYLNCGNVTWTPHGCHEPKPKDYITRYIDVNYIKERLENLQDSKWGKFLNETCTKDGVLDEELMEYLQLAVGYSIFGDNELQIIFFVYGPPDTGKSTFLEAIRSVLGAYAHTMASNAILKSKFQQQNTPDIAALEGKRLVVSSEMPKDIQLNEQLLKNLTGDEQISAMAKYKAPKTIKLEAKFWIAGNDLPAFSYEDMGVKKRIKVVPFTNVVPRDKIDSSLRQTFYNDEFEREIILAWLLGGAEKYKVGGKLDEPQCVHRATTNYFEHQDDLGLALLECTDLGMSHRVTAKELHEAVTLCLNASGKRAMSSTMIGRKLKERGFKKDIVNINRLTTVVWYGLRLNKDYEVMLKR